MNTLDTDQVGLFVAETAINLSRAVMEVLLSPKHFWKSYTPAFSFPEGENWLDSPVFPDLDDSDVSAVLDNTSASITYRTNSMTSDGWNRYLGDALEISLTRVLTERLMKDQTVAGETVQRVLKLKSTEWAKRDNPLDVPRGEKLIPLQYVLMNERLWGLWLDAVPVEDRKAVAAKVILAGKEEMKKVIIEKYDGSLTRHMPSIREVADTIAHSLSVTLDHGMEALSEIKKAREASDALAVRISDPMGGTQDEKDEHHQDRLERGRARGR